MAVCISESRFKDSELRTHYVPARRPSLAYRVVRAAICLVCFAAMGVVLAVGLSL